MHIILARVEQIARSLSMQYVGRKKVIRSSCNSPTAPDEISKYDSISLLPQRKNLSRTLLLTLGGEWIKLHTPRPNIWL